MDTAKVVRQATVDSITTAYVQLGEELDPAEIGATAGELGITSELPPYPSLVLGTGEVRPIDMAAAYATLAAEGTRHAPFLIQRIENDDGEVLYEHDPAPEGGKARSPVGPCRRRSGGPTWRSSCRPSTSRSSVTPTPRV